MKKRIAALLLALLLCVLTACGGGTDETDAREDTRGAAGQELEAMTIAPSVFTKETRSVLSALGDVTAFFDFAADDAAYLLTLDILTYQDGAWVGGDSGSWNLEPGERGRIGVRLRESVYELIWMRDSGSQKYLCDATADFSDMTMLVGMGRLTKAEKIVPGEPITLCVRLGTKENQLATVDLSDYENAECDAGVVIQATFTAEE